jgi:predicted transcriptional regulator
MSTTSLKLSEELKQRAETAAQELGMSTHAFMIGAIRQAAEAVELRSKFVAEAQAARTEMLASGMGYDADDVRSYLRKRLVDRNSQRPNLKPWRE